MNHLKIKKYVNCKLAHRCGAFIVTALLLMLPRIALAQGLNMAPNETYTPQQVISIVLDSMQKNVDDNEGIATVFRFASPENKSATGPLSRFTQMIKRGYPDMLNHTSARLEDIDIAGDVATQAVWLQTQSGTEYGYQFKLSIQRGGTHDGMWMTDSVIPIGKNMGIRL
jgi:hypothetical protein